MAKKKKRSKSNATLFVITNMNTEDEIKKGDKRQMRCGECEYYTEHKAISIRPNRWKCLECGSKRHDIY
ncbi:hypothetical protein [Risungbinella massiliensis]|uniref:hypothetical protein n=1 Tax=Risungbinella massiliensis TaxID=1329796 RepID=UPI0005CC7B1B|nr:hypothetical protein [Risungbinella massiliensis]